MKHILFPIFAVLLSSAAFAADPLPSWNDTAPKQAVVAFVEKVTTAGAGPRFCLYVHHTDASREWAYDRHSPIGRLDKGLDVAAAKGWIVVDMKQDWKTIFPFGNK